MNERIKELADEAKQHCFEQSQKRVDPKNYMSYSDMYDKKFAELIVRECADISDASFHNGSAGYTAILKHFGVEDHEQSDSDRILSTIRKRN